MATKHSFNSEIKNIHAFETEIKNIHSFQGEISNIHTFGEIPTVEPVIPTEQFWFSKIVTRFYMTINAVVANLHLKIEVSVPKIKAQINDTLLSMEQVISEGINVVITAPAINAVFNFFESISATINTPLEMSATIKDEQHLTNEIAIPGIQMEAMINTAQYYMMSYYDAYMLSDLDGNLLSDMDAVST